MCFPGASPKRHDLDDGEDCDWRGKIRIRRSHREVFSDRGPNGLLGMAFHPKFRETGNITSSTKVFEEGKVANHYSREAVRADFKGDSGQPRGG